MLPSLSNLVTEKTHKSSSQNAGQNCIGIERLIVHEDQYDDLYQIFSDMVGRLRPGSVLTPSHEGYISPVDCGAMISGDRFQSLQRLIEDAANEGAQVKGGAKQLDHVYHEYGTFFSSTVVGLANRNNDMEIAQTERRCWRAFPDL